MGVNLVGKSERERSAFDIEDDLRLALQDIAGCEITVSASSSMTMMSGNDINVEVSGDDYDTLEMIANDLKDQIAALPDEMCIRDRSSTTIQRLIRSLLLLSTKVVSFLLSLIHISSGWTAGSN